MRAGRGTVLGEQAERGFRSALTRLERGLDETFAPRRDGRLERQLTAVSAAQRGAPRARGARVIPRQGVRGWVRWPPVLLPAVDRYRMNYDDWCRFPDDGHFYEILEGELIVSPPPTPLHQVAAANIAFALKRHLGHAGVVIQAPVGVRLTAEDVPEPDIVVLLREHVDRIGKQVIEGAPDLVVEVLSPGTAQRDVGRKRDLYERHGVPEYWIVDNDARIVEVLALREGRYARFGLHGTGETIRSALLRGFALAVDEAFSL